MSVICHCDISSYLICHMFVLHARMSKVSSQRLKVRNLYSSMEGIILSVDLEEVLLMYRHDHSPPHPPGYACPCGERVCKIRISCS